MVPVSFENRHFSENTPENLLKFRDGLVFKVGFLSGEMKLYFEILQRSEKGAWMLCSGKKGNMKFINLPRP